MTEMSMVETLTIWSLGVSSMDAGEFEDALKKFTVLEGRTDSSQQLITSGRNLFNIGQTYLALGELENAAQSFQASVEKDKMMAVAHFMLGNVNLALNRDGEALQNFTDSQFYLRGNKLINYQQLGLKFKLYLCEILANRAIAHSRLGDAQEARDDFLQALQAKVEPRHSVIEDSLLSWQSGENVKPLMVPSHAVFTPQKKQLDAIKGKKNYLGESKVVAAHDVTKFPDSRPKTPTPSRKSFENEKPAEENGQATKEVGTTRQALMKDLRKSETRKSLKRVQMPSEPPNRSLSTGTDRPSSPRRPPPELRPSSPRTLPARIGAESRSPLLPRKKNSEDNSHSGMRLSAFNLEPPDKPLPPAPNKSPLPQRKTSSSSRTRDVTVQLLLTRSIKVNSSASANDLLRAAAETFKMPENSLGLWYKKNDQLSALEDEDFEGILNSPADERGTIYCYENKE